jgi:YD repeat-containing protein
MTIVERDWTLPESMPNFVYSWMFAGNAWSTVTGDGDEAITESRTRSELEEGRYQVETVLSKGGVVASRTLEIYADTDVGKLLLSSTEAYGTDDALTTTHTYDNLGRLISSTNPDGGTTNYRYDVQGRLVTETSPWGASGKRCVETSYRPDSDPYSSEPAQVKILLMTASSISTLRTDTYSYSTENGVKRVEVRSTSAGTSGTQLTVTETYEGSVENRFARGRLRMTQAANACRGAGCAGAIYPHGECHFL